EITTTGVVVPRAAAVIQTEVVATHISVRVWRRVVLARNNVTLSTVTVEEVMSELLTRYNSRADREPARQTTGDAGTDTRATTVPRTIPRRRSVPRRSSSRRPAAAILLIHSGRVTSAYDGPYHCNYAHDEQNQSPRNR